MAGLPCRCCGSLVELGATCPVDGTVAPEVAPEAPATEAEFIADQKATPVGESDYENITAVTRIKPARGNKR